MSNPTQLRKCAVVVSYEDSRRVDAFVQRVGFRAAVRLLGVGESTLRAGMDQGRMLQATHGRLFAALEREERAA